VDTIIGEKGVKLSGGEKQRLGIARAYYRRPEILLMDEATSHLDVDSEKKIQTSLHAFFNQVTAIVIAHRLSTIREMDVIVVMQGGKIIEKGSFTSLLAKEGVFSQLWEKQKL
jgi:ABC-type multidrug transport system fused ATPase/permease subunit